MEEPEKMEALKRAYAEMILNTAKEAAARIMAAESRARRLEQDLVSTKEDAARMLVHLKQMIDAKTKEAEITSLNQQRKCDELESQLNEAEGIIIDLRAELNQVKEQLDESKNKKLSSMRQNENEKLQKMALSGIYNGYELFTNSGRESIPADGDNSCLDHWTLDQRCCDPPKQSVNFNFENPDVDRTKETELLRSGCKQRICAMEAGSVRESFPVEDKSNPSSVQESFPVGDKSNPSDDSTNIEISNNIGSTSVLEENIQHGKNGAVSVVRRSLRKRKLKFWDDIITACGLRFPHQFKKPRPAFPQISCYNASKVEKCANSSGDQLQADDETQIEESLDPAEFPEKELPHTEALPENTELIDVLVKQDELAAAFELTSSSRIDCDVEGAVATEVPTRTHADGKKLYRYKFSRKWKKKSMIYPEEISSSGESLLQKENGNSGFQNSSLSTESYRESTQLVQVAHQLISLSGSSDRAVRSSQGI